MYIMCNGLASMVNDGSARWIWRTNERSSVCVCVCKMFFYRSHFSLKTLTIHRIIFWKTLALEMVFPMHFANNTKFNVRSALAFSLFSIASFLHLTVTRVSLSSISPACV